jgi:hypothetical protein
MPGQIQYKVLTEPPVQPPGTQPTWHQKFSEPVRRTGLVAAVVAAATGITWCPQPISGSGDVRAASVNSVVPHQRTLLYPSIAEPVALSAAETITVDKWYYPFNELARRRGYPTNAQDELSFVASDTATDNRWFVPLSEPTRRKLNPQPVAWSFVKADPFPETVSIDRWLQQLSEPRRFPRYIPNFQQPFYSYTEAAPFPETVSIDRWQQPLSDPVRRRGLESRHQPHFAAGFSDVAVDGRWYAPLAEPVRIKPALSSASQPYLSFVKADPFPETVSADRWHQPLSGPVRSRALATGQQPYFAVGLSDVATDARWFSPLSEPVRRKPLAEFGSFSWSEFTPASAEVITVDKYFDWLAEPVRFRQSLSVVNQPTLSLVKAEPFAEAVSIDRWQQPLSDPTRRKLGPPEFPSLSLSYTVVVAETITVDKWHSPLSGPTLAKPRETFPFASYGSPVSVVGDCIIVTTNAIVPYQRTVLHPTVAIPCPQEVISLDKWHAPLSGPTLAKPRQTFPFSFYGSPTSGRRDCIVVTNNTVVPYQRTVLHPTVAIPCPQIIVEGPTSLDKWWRPLSDPTRRKVSFAAHPSSFLVKAAPFEEIALVSKWFSPISLPTRRKVSFASHPSLFRVHAGPFGEQTLITKWFAPLSLPTRRKVSFAHHPSLFLVKASPFEQATPPAFSGITFPPFIQADFLVQGYTNKRDNAAVRSAMESGFDRVRLTNRNPLRVLSCAIFFTAYQAEFFTAWYDYTAKNGEVWFHIDIPIESVARTVLARFVGQPTLIPLANVADRWQLNAQFEINDANLVAREEFAPDDGAFPSDVLEDAVLVDNFSSKRAVSGNRSDASNEGIAKFRTSTLTPFRIIAVSWQWDDDQLAYFNEWLSYRARHEAGFFTIDVPVDNQTYRTVRARFSSPPVINAVSFNRWEAVAELEARDLNEITPADLVELEALFAEATLDDIQQMIILVEALTLDPFFDAWNVPPLND